MITLKNISQFIEGNLKMLGDQLNLLQDHECEQIFYRSQICESDCMRLGYCIYCGCDLPGKLYVNESCNNGDRFPDLMNKSDWEKFKSENGIKIE
jgi:hypothetical protein